MKFPGLNARRSRTLILVLAQLVLVAYVFQVGAFDHWGASPGHDITGVTGSDAHVAHCHGDAASCADASSGFATIAQEPAAQLPVERPFVVLTPGLSDPTPESALVLAQPEPPRTA